LSLGLNDETPIAVPAPRHKSAGLAFGLSFLIPGAGQFYCGKRVRGGATLLFWLAAVVLAFNQVPAIWRAQAMFVMPVLWIFSFLDA